jgi:hypothetical protein
MKLAPQQSVKDADAGVALCVTEHPGDAFHDSVVFDLLQL